MILQRELFWAVALASRRSMSNSFRSSATLRPGGLLQFSAGCSNRRRHMSAESSIRGTCPKSERRRDRTIRERGGCRVNWRTTSFLTKSCHFMPSILRKHHWSVASIRCTSALLTVQHSDPYSMMGSMYTLYRRSIAVTEIRELQRCWSRLCMAVRVMALRLQISGSLLQDEWIQQQTELKEVSPESHRWRGKFTPAVYFSLTVFFQIITCPGL